MTENTQTFAQYKKERTTFIQNAFKKPEVLDRFYEIYHNRIRSKNISEEEARLYVTNMVHSVLSYIINDEGQKRPNNKDVQFLWQCSVSSLISAAVDAVSIGIPLDSRGLAYMEFRGSEARYDLMFKGVLQKVQELYQNADIKTYLVFPEDKFSIRTNDDMVYVEHEPANPFRSDYENVAGCCCIIRYTINGRECAREERIDRAELEKIRKTASQDYVWKAYPGEKYKVATLKRACKLMQARNEDTAYLERIINAGHDLTKVEQLVASPTHGSKTLEQCVQEERTAITHEIPVEMPETQKQEKVSVNNTIEPSNVEQPLQHLEEKDESDVLIEADTAEKVTDHHPMSKWDRKTIIGRKGKVIQKDWKNSKTASQELIKEIDLCKSTEEAYEFFDKNDPLMAALIEDQFGDQITVIHQHLDKLSDGGEYAAISDQ